MSAKKEIRYIDVIFEKDENGFFTNNALLYQDILRFSLENNKTFSENNPIRLRELENWIVRNNREIVDYYKDLTNRNTPYSSRIHAREKRIRDKFDDLIQLHLIHNIGTVKGEKVKSDVPLYKYTIFGLMLALIIKTMNFENEISLEKDQDKILYKKKELENNNQSIYDLISFMLTAQNYSPYSYIFYFALFKKFKDKGVFNKFVQHIIGLCNSNLSVKNISHLFTYAVSMKFKDKEFSKNLLDLYRETIEELDPKVQNIVLYQLKLSTERRFEDKMNYLSKDYEKHRFMFRADYKSIVLEGNCEKCGQRTTKVISYFDYVNKTTLIDRNDPIRLDCEICKTKDSYIIPNF